MLALLCVVLMLVATLVLVVALFVRRPQTARAQSGTRRSCCTNSCGNSSSCGTPPSVGNICGRFDTEEVPESHGTSTLLLSCIDYRFVEGVVEVLRDEEHVRFYDSFSLAGGSLGYNQTVYPNWPPTWLDTVSLAQTLHHISQIIVVEHMDCGMYKAIYPDIVNMAQERALHLQNMQTFQAAMAVLYPTLAVRGYLIYLDGHAQRLV